MHILRRHLWKIAFVVLAALFMTFPAIDLRAAGLLHDTALGFRWRESLPAVWSYVGIKVLRNVLLWTLIGLLVLSMTVMRRQLASLRPRVAYLLVVLALGPGLVINTLLKDQFGRARPERVAEFGGSSRFTPAFVVAKECESNCSFVSGHAGMGFYVVSLAFVDPRRRRQWLAAGIALGGVAGLMRMVQGQHFLSDVVFAFFAVYFTAAITHHLFQRLGWLPSAVTAVDADAGTRAMAAGARSGSL